MITHANKLRQRINNCKQSKKQTKNKINQLKNRKQKTKEKQINIKTHSVAPASSIVSMKNTYYAKTSIKQTKTKLKRMY